jgi:lipid II:glycine glycyltransferase (peptidoglycan interpeptide bridge formation enzyme)
MAKKEDKTLSWNEFLEKKFELAIFEIDNLKSDIAELNLKLKIAESSAKEAQAVAEEEKKRQMKETKRRSRKKNQRKIIISYLSGLICSLPALGLILLL